MPVARGKTALRTRGTPAPAITRWAHHRRRRRWARDRGPQAPLVAVSQAALSASGRFSSILSNLMPTPLPVFIYDLNYLLK